MSNFKLYKSENCLSIFDSVYKNKTKLKMLDVGGKDGVLSEYQILTNRFEYFSLEYDKTFCNQPNKMFGDITDCGHIEDNSYDLIFSTNTLEHVTKPWLAAEHMIRILKKECLMFIVAPFSWKYHEHPIDYWRFSPNGLEYLFNHNNSMETTIKGWYRPDCLSLYIGKKI